MKYLPLIWSGVWRRRARAVLMLLQIVSAFALFGVLQGVSSGTHQAIASRHSDRLYIASSVSASDPLPIALLERIRAMPGIRAVSPRTVFLGTYQKPDQRLPVIAVYAEPFFQIFGELDAPASRDDAEFQETRPKSCGNGSRQNTRMNIHKKFRADLNRRRLPI